jgi:hypothetical protein
MRPKRRRRCPLSYVLYNNVRIPNEQCDTNDVHCNRYHCALGSAIPLVPSHVKDLYPYRRWLVPEWQWQSTLIIAIELNPTMQHTHGTRSTTHNDKIQLSLYQSQRRDQYALPDTMEVQEECRMRDSGDFCFSAWRRECPDSSSIVAEE